MPNTHCPSCGSKIHQEWVNSCLEGIFITRATMRCRFCSTEYEVSVFRDVPSHAITAAIASRNNQGKKQPLYQYALPGIPKEKK